VKLPLLTPRLLVRAWTPADVDAAFGLLGNPTTMGRMRAGRADSLDDAATWVAKRIEQQVQTGLTMWAVERREAPGLVGACGIFPHEDGLELGYIVDHRHVGNGYAREVARAVCDCVRDERPGERIYATIRLDNAASIHVAERIGFRLTESSETSPLLVYEL
jgi:RimJ/RimL family protein N-acetyltransferase